MNWHIPVPKLRLPFRVRSAKDQPDPLEREFARYSTGRLIELHEANMKLLRQRLEELREWHRKNANRKE